MFLDPDKIHLKIPQGLSNLEEHISRILVKLSECFIGKKGGFKEVKVFYRFVRSGRKRQISIR